MYGTPTFIQYGDYTGPDWNILYVVNNCIVRGYTIHSETMHRYIQQLLCTKGCLANPFQDHEQHVT